MKSNIYFSIRFFLFLFFIGFMCSCKNKDVLEPKPSPTPHKPALTTDTAFVISEGLSAIKEAERLQQNFQSTDFTPTGLYLPPGVTLQVNVQLEAGTRLPKLLVGTYYRDSVYWEPATYALKEGINTISNKRGGLVYLRYVVTDRVPTGKANVRFISGFKPVPFYVLGKTTHNDWLNMLNTYNTVPDVILVSNKAMIVSSLSKAIQYKEENQDRLLSIVNEVINAEDYISGLDGSKDNNQPNAYRYLMTETNADNILMFATQHGTAFNSRTMNHLLTVNGFGKEGWGPWHELGHMHQQYWSWDEVDEVTVNIYTLAAERKRGITPSRLHRDNVWEKASAFLSLPDTERDFNTKADNWVKLCMFQQLWLAFGDKFYQQLHQRTRQKQKSFYDTKDKMRFFMLNACRSSGKNLSDFFTKWGFIVSHFVYDEIADLNLPKPDSDLTQLKD